VVITEIGGTVGDIESLPFLEAIRQFSLEEGRGRCLFIHLTLLPYLNASGELKTKPSQQSVGKLREIGITPDILICRTVKQMTDEMRDKLSMFCNVDRKAVIEECDVDFSIYEVPVNLVREGLDRLLVDFVGLPEDTQAEFGDWMDLLERIRCPVREIEIAVVGKYIQLEDAYKSHYESLAHAGATNRTRVRLRRIPAEKVTDLNVGELLSGAEGILVPGGFGERGFEGKVRAAGYARENAIPYLGICYGMQAAVIDHARNVLGIPSATTTEFGKSGEPVIDLMEEQKKIRDLGGTMRLGAYRCEIRPGTRLHEVYGTKLVTERHRHRFELNNDYRARLENAGLVASGINPEVDLVEAVEISGHPFFVGVQFHPEFRSRPLEPHPLFRSLVKAALVLKEAGARKEAGRPGKEVHT
ncbi:MAG: CTP synthase, partial [Planctomycetota bacterium]